MRIAAGIALAIAFVAAFAFAVMREARVGCEVCIEYGGGSACREARGADRELALRGATTAVCAELAAGVTRGIECANTPPQSVRCE
jgi:hypothetical protein